MMTTDPTYGYATVIAYATAGMQTQVFGDWLTIQSAKQTDDDVVITLATGAQFVIPAETMIAVRFPLRDPGIPTPFPLRQGDRVLIEATVYDTPCGEDDPPEDYYTFEIQCGDRQASPPTELVSMNSAAVRKVIRRTP